MSAAKGTPEHQQTQNGSGMFRRNVLVIALSSGIRSLGSFVGVYIPLYFVQIGGNPLTLGLLASIASLIQFFTLSIGGFIADYYGRRRLVVFAIFYAAFFLFLYGVVQDWRVFCALTLLAAIGTIGNPAYSATVADSVSPEKRTTGIAFIQVISSFPSAISPLIGGWLIENYGLESGFRIACLYAAAFAFISAIPVLVLLKETLEPRGDEKPDFPWKRVFFGLTKHSADNLPSSLKVLIVSFALVAFSNGAVAQYYVLYVSSVVGLAALSWGTVVSLQFLLVTILKIPGGMLSDRFGKKRIMVISLLTTAPMILLFTLSRSFMQVVIVALLLVATGIYYAPAHEALQADLTPKSMRGRITALWNISNATATALGALVGGFTFQAVGPAVPFYVFAVTELGAALLLIRMVKEPKAKEA